MKKILLLLVGAIVAFATHAQYYVAFQIGSAGGTGSTTNEVSSSTGECEWSNLKIGTSGFQIKCWDGSKDTYSRILIMEVSLSPKMLGQN